MLNAWNNWRGSSRLPWLFKPFFRPSEYPSLDCQNYSQSPSWHSWQNGKVICNMLGINPEELSTNKEAIRSGEVDNFLHVSGDINITTDFDFPETGNGVYGPRQFHRFIRKHMLQRPVCDQNVCQFCGSCREICPVKAISGGRDNLFFDYDKCIRCYCCIEVCPHGAISATEPLPGKLIKSLADVYSWLLM